MQKMVNAADPAAIKEQEVTEKSVRDKEVSDLAFILSHPQGRRFIWRLLAFCGVFKSIMEASARVYYNSGKQDVGHFVMAEVLEASEESYLKMMRENKKKETT